MGTFAIAMDLGIGVGSIAWGLVAQAFGFRAVWLGSAAVACVSLAVLLAGTLAGRGRAAAKG